MKASHPKIMAMTRLRQFSLGVFVSVAAPQLAHASEAQNVFEALYKIFSILAVLSFVLWFLALFVAKRRGVKKPKTVASYVVLVLWGLIYIVPQLLASLRILFYLLSPESEAQNVLALHLVFSILAVLSLVLWFLAFFVAKRRGSKKPKRVASYVALVLWGLIYIVPQLLGFLRVLFYLSSPR